LSKEGCTLVVTGSSKPPGSSPGRMPGVSFKRDSEIHNIEAVAAMRGSTQ
jgi:hypothetical protein